MSKLFYLSCILILISIKSVAQQREDDPLVYSRVLIVDSLSKGDIYDRSLIWCSKSFSDSKGAINVKDKESGIVAGKASLKNYYKIPRKKDSADCFYFVDYFFDWLIEIKDNKARLSLKNIQVSESDIDYPVTTSINPPVKIYFQSPEKQQMIWDLSKKSFLRYMDAVADNLYSDLKQKDTW
jgi:hypothetical protein